MIIKCHAWVSIFLSAILLLENIRCLVCSVLVKQKFNSWLICHVLSLSLQGDLLVHLNQHKEAADVFQEIMKIRYAFWYLGGLLYYYLLAWASTSTCDLLDH